MVLVARAIEEMSVEETAALLNIRPETVKTRLHRARHRLRTALEAKIGPVFKDVFPFEDPRCERIADAVVAQLKSPERISGTFVASFHLTLHPTKAATGFFFGNQGDWKSCMQGLERRSLGSHWLSG